MLEVMQWGPQLLLYVTQRGGVHAWDLRAKQVGGGSNWGQCVHAVGQYGITQGGSGGCHTWDLRAKQVRAEQR